MNVTDELISRLIAILVFLVVATAPFLILAAGWWRLSGLRRAHERSKCFLTLLEIGLQQGRTPEQTFLSIARHRVSDLGPGFEALVARLRDGRSLGTALEEVPR